MTRRTIGHTRSTDGSRLKRLVPALVLLPLLAVLLTAAALLFALFLLVVVLVTAALALTAVGAWRRPGRAS